MRKRVSKETKLLAAIVEYSNDAIVSIDLNAKLISWNKGAENILGFKEQEILGKSFQLLIPKDQKTKTKEIIDKIKEGNSFQNFETVRLHKDGSRVNVSVSAFPLKGVNNEIIGTSAIIRDITENKKNELIQTVSYNIAREANRRVTDIKTLSKAIHAELCNIIDAKNFYIALYNEKDNTYLFPYHVDEYECEIDYAPKELNGSLTDYVRRTGRALLIDEKTHNDLISKGKASMIGAPSKVWLGVPLKAEKKAVGVMVVQSYDNQHAYNENDLKFLKFVSGQIANVLERQLVIEEMFRSGEYYRTLSEKATDITTIHNKEGQITYASQSVKAMMGYKPHELIGKNVLKYIHPEDAAVIKDKLRKENGMQTLINLFEFRAKHKNGSWRYLESTGRDLTNNHIIKGVVVNSRDVTKRKNTQEALQQSEAQYKTVVKQSLTAIYMFDPVTGKILEANETFFSYTGYSKGDLNKLSLYDFVDHDKKGINKHIKSILKKVNADIGERRWLQKNGVKINVLVSASKIHQQNEDIIVVTALDITAQKKTEEELRAKNRELDTFVYKASHDLRSPLATILGLISVSRREIKDAAAIKYMDLLNRSAVKLDEILEDLTQITIIRQGQIDIESIKVTPFINDIVESFQPYPYFEEINFKINNKLKRAFRSDRRLLKTILRNIIENAIKYKRFNSERSYIKITTESDIRNTIIKIADNGMGIPEKYQENIYDMFYRATERSQGSGLGLYIVKNAIEKLGGSIELKSKEKTGTTFTIFLPKN